MRTTVTLEPDVHARIEAYARQARTSFRAALNEVLRRGLVAGEASPNVAFRVVPHEGLFVPGIDPSRLNQLLDELEVDDFVGEATDRS